LQRLPKCPLSTSANRRLDRSPGVDAGGGIRVEHGRTTTNGGKAGTASSRFTVFGDLAVIRAPFPIERGDIVELSQETAAEFVDALDGGVASRKSTGVSASPNDVCGRVQRSVDDHLGRAQYCVVAYLLQLRIGQSEPWRDAQVDGLAVHALLVGLTSAVGEDARPGDGERVGVCRPTICRAERCGRGSRGVPGHAPIEMRVTKRPCASHR
jgi:hypothetical protein